ncbi:MAG: helix-turn-helix domain-containing protein [Lactobacillus crispatus]
MFGEKLKAIRTKNHLSMDDLAKELNKKFNTKISKSMISRWESNQTDPSITNVKYLMKFFGVDYSYFVEDTDNVYTNKLYQPSNAHPLSKNIVKVPVIGQIAMGMPITAEQNIEGYDAIELQYDTPADELFELECKGHSMEPTIPDGAIGLFEITNEVEDGEIAAVQVDHDEEATLKRIQHSKDQVLLKPDNPNYPTLTIDKDHPGRIVGRLLEYRVKMHRN